MVHILAKRIIEHLVTSALEWPFYIAFMNDVVMSVVKSAHYQMHFQSMNQAQIQGMRMLITIHECWGKPYSELLSERSGDDKVTV